MVKRERGEDVEEEKERREKEKGEKEEEGKQEKQRGEEAKESEEVSRRHLGTDLSSEKTPTAMSLHCTFSGT